MKRRFIVSVAGLSEAQTAELRKYLSDNFAWWNWIPNFWLLTSARDDVSCEQVRDKIQELSGNAKCLAMEVPGDIDWAYLGAVKKDGKTMGDWLNSTWAEE